MYYREPELEDLYYLGYCDGPARTARLFYQLYKVTRETAYLQWAEMQIGAAGIGAALLHTHLSVRGRYSALLLPDNPFARTRPATV